MKKLIKQTRWLMLFSMIILMSITQIEAGTLIKTTTPWIPNSSDTTVTNSDGSVTMTRPDISGYRFLFIRLSQTGRNGALSRDLEVGEKITIKIRAKSSSTKSYIYSKFLDFPLTHFDKVDEYQDFTFKTTVKSNISSYAWLGLFTIKTGDTVTVQSVEIVEEGSIALENIGAQAVTSTDASKGTKYASPNGNGSGESLDDPADIEKAFSTLVAGDVLFLKGGVYDVSNKFLAIRAKGTSSNPIIVESYPGEKAILDGKDKIYIENGERVGDIVGMQLKTDAEYVQIRKIAITHSGGEGVVVYGSHNIIEGNEIYNNKIAGIRLNSIKFDGSSWNSGYNIIQNNVIHDNSDVGLTHGSYRDGGNADGISISRGSYNKVLHNTVYNNSDDGIDTWHSNDTEVAYNIVYGHGIGSGDGGGIKLGGDMTKSTLTGMRAYAHHNISYGNRSMGFNLNAGRGVRIENNTAYNNGQYGFVLGSYEKLGNYTPSLKNNISFENNKGDLDINHEKGQENNSWQMDDSIEFISTDSQSNGFLRPVIDSDMGAISYSNI